MSAPPSTRPRRAGLSVRAKLTLSYAGFLVIAGAALFAVGFFLLRYIPEGNLWLPDGSPLPTRRNLVDVFVKYAWWALGGLFFVGLVGGWLLSGLVLRPLQRITDAARRVRDGSLDTRVGLPGARDELTDLADTLDTMLDRIERAVDEERRFAANASHELRTPHAIIRTMVEVAQADTDGRDVDTLLERIGATNDRAIASTEALLALARITRGTAMETAPIDLSAVVRQALAEESGNAAERGIRITSDLAPSIVRGNRGLLERLTGNLVRNAIVHNVDGGWIDVKTGQSGLVVANGGEILDPAVAATLTEPFVRAGGRVRDGSKTGAGLGLAIVASIVRAHRGSLFVEPLAEGGLRVRVVLPR